MKALVPGLTMELAAGMTAIVIGVYPLIGGLGATFYVSYFNTAITFAIILVFTGKLLHDQDNNLNGKGRVIYYGLGAWYI